MSYSMLKTILYRDGLWKEHKGMGLLSLLSLELPLTVRMAIFTRSAPLSQYQGELPSAKP